MARKSQSKKTSSKHKVRPIPSGYHAVTPYLPVRGAAKAIDFYTEAFGAKELFRMPGPDDKLGHVELQIGDSRVMLSDEHESMEFLGPQSRGGTTVHMHLYVEDAEDTFERATALGAREVMPLEKKFYGDLSGCVEDPFGHYWHIATHVEDVPEGELMRKAQERAQAASKQPQPQAVS